MEGKAAQISEAQFQAVSQKIYDQLLGQMKSHLEVGLGQMTARQQEAEQQQALWRYNYECQLKATQQEVDQLGQTVLGAGFEDLEEPAEDGTEEPGRDEGRCAGGPKEVSTRRADVCIHHVSTSDKS